ncbi:hypothetical protein SCP_0305560 [Sparassis crispa]|uniref:Uncharacterized protein n=1 Tax=Sparassis crispa TaxID=139825 RepID=A0A401GF72_9APHY|nr:hypothetical protein SCP_0305560 [Sparassis crispa]GBE80836.1 hypothetical protein SCP_0305560 [Sparassis crispa]
MSSERSISVTSLHTIPESRLELELAEDELSFPTFEISPTSMASPRYSWLPNIVQRNLPWRAPAGSVMSMPVPVLETPESSVQVRSLAALHSTPEMLEAEDEPPMSSGMIGFSGYTYLSSSTADYYSLSRPLPVPPTC